MNTTQKLLYLCFVLCLVGFIFSGCIAYGYYKAYDQPGFIALWLLLGLPPIGFVWWKYWLHCKE